MFSRAITGVRRVNKSLVQQQSRDFGKVVCVLYDDPKGGYPTSYPRDSQPLPKLTHYPDQFGKPGQTVPSPANQYVPQNGVLLGSVSGELGIRKYLEENE